MKLQTLTLSNFQGMKRFTLPVYGRNASIWRERHGQDHHCKRLCLAPDREV